MTLAVAGILIWTVVFAYGSSSGMNIARGLPTDDPCAVLEEDTLSAVDAETRSWSIGGYSNTCTWKISVAGEEECT